MTEKTQPTTPIEPEPGGKFPRTSDAPDTEGHMPGIKASRSVEAAPEAESDRSYGKATTGAPEPEEAGKVKF